VTDTGLLILLNLNSSNFLNQDMPFKFESKECFHVIKVEEPELTASLSEELSSSVDKILHSEPTEEPAIRNLILDLGSVERIELSAAEKIIELQAAFYESGASFVVCCLQAGVQQTFELADLAELLNSTPTESEAWDIVQMEEIERELLGGEED